MVFELILWLFTTIFALRVLIFVIELLILDIYHWILDFIKYLNGEPQDQGLGKIIDVLL